MRKFFILGIFASTTIWALPADSSAVMQQLVKSDSDFHDIFTANKFIKKLTIQTVDRNEASAHCSIAASRSSTTLRVDADIYKKQGLVRYFSTAEKPQDLAMCEK